MSLFYEKPVYREARELYKQIKKHTDKTQREYRYYFIVPEMVKICDVMKYIAKFDKSNSLNFLENAITVIGDLKIDIRNWFEINLITEKGFAILSDQTEKVYRQLKGWHNHMKQE